MKENYTVSFVKNDVNQCRLVKAESKEQALAYFAEIEPDAEICGAALDQCNLERRGCPVEIVPDGWTPAPAEDEQEQSAETFTVTFYSAVSRSMCIENFDDRFKAEKFARQMLEAVDYSCVIVSTLRGMKLIEETRFFK